VRLSTKIWQSDRIQGSIRAGTQARWGEDCIWPYPWLDKVSQLLALYTPGTASYAPASYSADPYPGPQVQSIDEPPPTQRYYAPAGPAGWRRAAQHVSGGHGLPLHRAARGRRDRAVLLRRPLV
jgi:hypothetical protein